MILALNYMALCCRTFTQGRCWWFS